MQAGQTAKEQVMIVDTLRVFVMVVEQSHFSRAAEMLNLSQPGVSLHIRNLENEFGAKLVHRSSKQVKVTEAGEILYQQAKQMLALYDSAKEAIRQLRDEVAGTLKIGASLTIGEYVLPRFLAEFTAQYPQIDISVTIGNTEEIAQAVRSHELDIGLVEGNVEHAEIELQPPFMEDELVLVAPADHPLCVVKKAVDIEMLQDHVWVLREPGSGTRAFSDQFMEKSGIRMRRSYVFSSSQGVKEAVVAGLGVAMLSRLVVRKELETGELCSIPVKQTRLLRDFRLLRDKRSAVETMAAKMFIQKLRQFQG
ncbi:LysR substrate-binding domain-containing protein [Paenibacillus sp. 32352]|uniref:LysR substrate-binding domain-containing protein n=1 Tax=Paenibacillus sp. 32352 TaxID=1969111 RepID=UPI00277B49FF|nr:LysR substrate-binding domain-containing protein [Paenibacillus sp. 32352]